MACKVLDGEISRILLITLKINSEKLLTTTKNVSQNITWAPGASILYQQSGNRNFTVLNPRTGEQSDLIANDSVGWMFLPVYSPAHHKVAVSWNRYIEEKTQDRSYLAGARRLDGGGIWVISLQDSSQKRVYPGMTLLLGWPPNGEWIYFCDRADTILRVRISDGIVDTVFSVSLSPSEVVMNLDGTKFVFNVPESHSDVWLVKNFDPDYSK